MKKVDVGKLVKVEGCSLAHDHYDDQDQEQMAGPQGGLCEAARAGDLGLVNTLLTRVPHAAKTTDQVRALT